MRTKTRIRVPTEASQAEEGEEDGESDRRGSEDGKEGEEVVLKEVFLREVLLQERDDATGQVWWYDGRRRRPTLRLRRSYHTPEISGEVDVDEKEGAAVDYYEYETADPATKARELREVEANARPSVSSSSRKTEGSLRGAAAARAKLNKARLDDVPLASPPEPPDYSDIIEAASLAMNEGVGTTRRRRADEAHRQRDSPDGERDRGEQAQPVRGVQRPDATFGEKKQPLRAGPIGRRGH